MSVEMKNSPYPSYSEKKLKKLKKNYAYVEKYDYFCAGGWAFVGTVQAGSQWLLGHGPLLSGMILTAYGAIAFAFFDRKHAFCRYKTLFQEEIEGLLSRYFRYKRISLFFGILGLVDIIIWLSIGLLLHGRYALRMMFNQPTWFLFGFLFWVPWMICRNRVQMLNFIRLSQHTEENM